jgi:hypothetical protein
VVKVECRACGSIHKYRDAGVKTPRRAEGQAVRHVRAGQGREEARDLGVTGLGRLSSDDQDMRKSPPAKGRSPRNTPKLHQAWEESMTKLTGETPQLYSMSGVYTPHTLVEHPVFGRGEVLSVTRPDKVEILFEDGVKTLRCKT